LALACIGAVFAAMTVKYRHTRVFKSAQPPFLLVLVLGVITSLSSVVPASLSHLSFEVDDPSRIGQRGMYVALDEMCVAEEWLAELGFTLTASAVFVKLWRIKKLLVNPQLKKIQVNVKEGLAVVGFFVVFDLFVLTVMTIVDPPFYKFEFKYDAEGDIIEDYSTCETGTFGTVCTMTVEVLKIVFLIVGMVIVVQVYALVDAAEYTQVPATTWAVGICMHACVVAGSASSTLLLHTANAEVMLPRFALQYRHSLSYMTFKTSTCANPATPSSPRECWPGLKADFSCAGLPAGAECSHRVQRGQIHCRHRHQLGAGVCFG